MLDCLSNGRLISGFARGIPREYQVHNVPLAELPRALRGGLRDRHPRLDRGRVLLLGQVLVVQERGDLAAAGAAAASAGMDADRRQPGNDRVRRPAQHRHHAGPRAAADCATTSSGYYAKCLAAAGHRITPDHLSSALNAYVADSKAQAVREVGPYHLYFNQTLFSHGNFTETAAQRKAGYVGEIRPITCGRRTCARPRCCARISAT